MPLPPSTELAALLGQAEHLKQIRDDATMQPPEANVYALSQYLRSIHLEIDILAQRLSAFNKTIGDSNE